MRRLVRAGRGERHRTLLSVEIADSASVGGPCPAGPDDEAAGHLASCPPCRSEVEASRLTAHRLRRHLAATRDLEPGSGAWTTLERRIARRPARSAGAARQSLGGVLGAGLAAALLVAIAVPSRPVLVDEPDFDPRSVIAQGRRDVEQEARWLRDHADVRVPAPSSVSMPGRGRPGLARYGESDLSVDDAVRVIPATGAFQVR